jgi:hypothetical protein
MGCFDNTCCISGLAIKREDPIKFGLVSETGSSRVSAACGKYNFWTLLFSGKYDEYGSVLYDSIEDKALWDWTFGKIIPHIKPEERFKEHATKSENPEDIFTDLISHTQCIFPESWSREMFPKSKGAKVHMWMCHEWAYQGMLALHQKNIAEDGNIGVEDQQTLESHAENYVNYGIPTEERCRERLSFVEGQHGLLTPYFRIDLLHDREKEPYELFGDQREPFKAALIESVNFVQSLFLVRKGIDPQRFAGQQHEDNNFLLDWTRLVAQQAEQQVKNWREEFGCEEEED